MTGGRVRRVRDYLDDAEPFFLTYGDGLSDVDITAALEFHRAHDALVTVTAVRPRARFGILDIADDKVTAIYEKDPSRERYVNGGFFVVDPAAIDRITGDSTIWESEVLPALAAGGELGAFEHDGFWQPMDTLWEKELLDALWVSGNAPWKVW